MVAVTGQPRDRAWAERQRERQGGRPHRMTVMCLLAGREAEAWREMSREQQVVALRPFVLEGESIRFSSQTGEGFIVPDATGGMGQGDASSFSLDELKAAAAARAHWVDVSKKLERSAYQRAYAQASLDMAPRYVELENQVLDRALAADSTPAERRMAMAAWKDWKDRHMGKPVAPTEDVTAKPSEIGEWIALEAPEVLPLSAGWTVESVAEEQRKQLEAGTLDGGGE